MYQVRRPHQSQFVSIRNLDYHVQVWGEPGPGKVPLVMVHGWMDVAASYQFVVDAFSEDHYIIAPDWRGYGRTRAPLADNYWFPDYLADLDFLLDHYAPDSRSTWWATAWVAMWSCCTAGCGPSASAGW